MTKQIDRFKEAARQLEVDEDELAFDKKLRAITKPKANEEHQMEERHVDKDRTI